MIGYNTEPLLSSKLSSRNCRKWPTRHGAGINPYFLLSMNVIFFPELIQMSFLKKCNFKFISILKWGKVGYPYLFSILINTVQKS